MSEPLPRAYVGKGSKGLYNVADADSEPLSIGFHTRTGAVSYAEAMGYKPWLRNPVWIIDGLVFVLKGYVKAIAIADQHNALRLLRRQGPSDQDWVILYAVECIRTDRRESVLQRLEAIA